MAAPPAWVDDSEALYRETGNGLLPWEVIRYLSGEDPLPGWVERYLRGIACELLRPVEDASLDPDVTRRGLQGILGLTKGGAGAGNAWTERRQMQVEADLAFAYEARLKRAPGTSAAIITAAARVLRTTSKTIHERIRRARQRWQLQQVTKKHTN